ncbi:MAG: hypothetical protein EOM53_01700 [Alphaproteobacteria bacterium]|nr:hypothetical protein [Alphaproteobacteria bacterium]
MNEQQMLYAMLRDDFKLFTIKVFNEVSGGAEYKDNWHIDVICEAIMDMMEGKNNRLIVNIPPRNMKSIIGSIALPAFLLGHNPKTKIICVSYADDLSTKFANDCRNILQSYWFKEMFPATRLSQSRKSISDFETTAGGGRFATSIGGVLTGRGADWIIIDDPLKPAEAMSDTQREKVNEWYKSTLYSRLDDKETGKIILIMQRLHQNDLTRYLLGHSNNFRHIKLPAIAEYDEAWKIFRRSSQKVKIFTRQCGEALHPARESIDVLLETQRTISDYAYAGQYQQAPVPLEGGIIKRNWFHTYENLPILREIIISWDLASKTGTSNSYSAGIILGIGKDKIYQLDCIKFRAEFPELVQEVIDINQQMKDKYKVSVTTLIEDASAGTQVIQYIKNGRHFTPVEIRPNQDKKVRLEGVSAYIKDGTILFPNERGPWWDDFADELTTFPNSTFSDQCDAFSQGLEYAVTRLKKPEVRVRILF